MGPFKTHIYETGRPLTARIAGLPAPFGTAGCWKQRSAVEATHLPYVQVFNWIHTARAGLFAPNAPQLGCGALFLRCV